MAQSPNSTPVPQAPGWRRLIGEARVLQEILSFYRRPSAESPPVQGQQQPILLIPGYGASERYMQPLAKRLGAAGFSVYGWGEGYNLGMRASIKQRLADRLDEIGKRHQMKVALLGWSLGGVFVREIARHHPQQVSMVFTLGSPITGHPSANNMARLFNLFNRGKEVDADMAAFNRRSQPPPLPCVAIFSKRDGIVAWQCAQEKVAPNTENVEVCSSHFGMPYSAEVAEVVARRLAGYRSDQSGQLAD